MSLKEDQIQLVTDSFGDIPQGNSEGYGLYMSDTRFLSAFELAIDNQAPVYLSHSAERNYIATFQFVNPPLITYDGVQVRRQTISIRRSRFVDRTGLHERIGFYNCNHFPVEIEVMLTFDADFLDIFAVRQFAPQRRGNRSSVRLSQNRLTFSYTGRDRLGRKTVIHYDRRPEPVSSNAMMFRLRLEPQTPQSITLGINPILDSAPVPARTSFDLALTGLAESYKQWHEESTSFETNNEFFDRSLLQQSRLDIRALMEFSGPDREGEELIFPAAGIPWYAVPFGRDSIIVSLQTLGYNPRIAEGTLRVLSHHQGVRVDEKTEEEPGKIFHELRRGELANLGEIPHVPYYGTVDATPLFVILFIQTMDWLGDSERGVALYRDLLPIVLRALEWVDAFGDCDADGYVEYKEGLAAGVRNQGWKDSQDSVQYLDGTNAIMPIALVEVQGYVYQAKRGLSRLASERGDTELAARLDSEAEALKGRFNRDFWMPGERFFAQALDGHKAQVPSITSNVGHLLWSGIVDADKADAVVERLMSDDMFSGWGIRTLSSRSPNYNPMSYHNGSVWPHDNSLIAAGMRAYGFDREAGDVIDAMISAGLRFPGNRLPELFCGFPRDRRFNSSPAAYIVSCSPQAWAAASPFLFLDTILGISPSHGRSVRIDPMVSNLFSRFRISHMALGDGRVSFEVQRHGHEFHLTEKEGDVRLVNAE